MRYAVKIWFHSSIKDIKPLHHQTSSDKLTFIIPAALKSCGFSILRQEPITVIGSWQRGKILSVTSVSMSHAKITSLLLIHDGDIDTIVNQLLTKELTGSLSIDGLSIQHISMQHIL